MAKAFTRSGFFCVLVLLFGTSASAQLMSGAAGQLSVNVNEVLFSNYGSLRGVSPRVLAADIPGTVGNPFYFALWQDVLVTA